MAMLSGLTLLACSGLIHAVVMPAREMARRTTCNCNLKIIGLALHNYHDAYGAFPPAYIADEKGRPMHSWRVLILPFLGSEDLYREYDFTQPWDSPKNRRLLAYRPPNLSCPTHGSNDPTMTSYAGVFGPDSVFRGTQPVRLREISDGSSSTMMVGEAVHANIPWTKPEDIDVTIHGGADDAAGFGSDHKDIFYILLADGSVRSVAKDIPKAVRNAMFTIDGKESSTFPD